MNDIGNASPKGFTFTPWRRSLPLSGRSPFSSSGSASQQPPVRGRRASEIVPASTVTRCYQVPAPRESPYTTSTTAPLLKENRWLDSPFTTSPSLRSSARFELSKSRRSNLPMLETTFTLGASTTVANDQPGMATFIQPVGYSLPRKSIGEKAGSAFPPLKMAHLLKPSHSLHPRTLFYSLLANEVDGRTEYEDKRELLGVADQPYADSRRTILCPETSSRQGTMSQLDRRPSQIQSIWRSRAYGLKTTAAVAGYGALFFAIGVVIDRSFPYCEHPIKFFDSACELEASMDNSMDLCSDMYGPVGGCWYDQYPGKRHQFALLNKRPHFLLLQAAEWLRNFANAADNADLALWSCMRARSGGDVNEDIYIGDVIKQLGLTLPATMNAYVPGVFRQPIATTLKNAISVF
ncbi:hypothetical protein MRX96_025885 [Rhipicephalus microplus]